MSSKSRVLLIGSGAVGTIGAYNLESGGEAEVTAVCRSNFKIIIESGLTIDSCDHGKIKGWRPTEVLNRIPNIKETEAPPFDFLVCSTKNIADVSPTVATLIAPAVTPGHTVIVLIQNGLNIEKPIFAAFPSNIVLSGVSMIGAQEVAPGSIVHEDPDILQIGPFHNQNLSRSIEIAAARRFTEMYDAGASTCEYAEDVAFSRWRKLIYNGSWNPVCAITGLDVDRLRHTPTAIQGLVRPAMEEIFAIAKAAGVNLPDDIVEWGLAAPPIDIYTKPSMQADMERGNYTEYENLIGEPLREAQRFGVLAPTLKILYELCSALQWKQGDKRGLFQLPSKKLVEK